jgi:phosphatidylinositol-3-phosphatase
LESRTHPLRHATYTSLLNELSRDVDTAATGIEISKPQILEELQQMRAQLDRLSTAALTCSRRRAVVAGMHAGRGTRGVLVLVAIALAATATASAATNLIKNGTFEGTGSGSLSGWGGSSGTLSLVTGNGGGHAAQLTASSGASQTYAYTSSKPVTSAVAGTAYQLTADVSSALAGQSVCLVLKELMGTTTTSVGSTQTCLTPTSAWQSFPPVSYTVKTSGDSLTVNVLEKPAVSGATFAFDNVVLQTGSGGGGGDTTPPSVPTGVSASANGPTSVTVSWNPSTDASGVAGYDVYRDGTKVATVGGSQTSYTDNTVQPSMTYGYTVDAFDPVPNTSAQSSPAASVTTPSGGGTGPAEPIVIIMEENKTYQDIVGNTNAPYIQSLIAKGTLYTNYQAAPGSLPDYLLNTSGVSTTTAASGSDNIFHQLQAAGVSWGEYEESMPSACYTGGDTGQYKKGHNPAVYYTDIKSDPSACANAVPYTAFDPAHLRAFSYVVPNLAHDMHDGANKAAEIAAGDAWLSANVPAMLNAGAEVIVTWDEGNSSNEHVATIAAGGTVAAGAKDGTGYTHPGLLAGLEHAWGFPRLNAAASATPLPIS